MSALTRHCHKCGLEWHLGQPGLDESCLGCNSDLRVCLNCSSYDPWVVNECRDNRAVLIREKTVGNFCEYFDFVHRVRTSNSALNFSDETDDPHSEKIVTVFFDAVMPRVRVIGKDSTPLGVMLLSEAKKMALDNGVDLVEIDSRANPPICRLIEFGKYRYEKAKKEKIARKASAGPPSKGNPPQV